MTVRTTGARRTGAAHKEDQVRKNSFAFFALYWGTVGIVIYIAARILGAVYP